MSEFLPANGFDASSRELFNQRMQAGAPKPIALGSAPTPALVDPNP